MRHESYSTTLPVLFLFLPQFTERIRKYEAAEQLYLQAIEIDKIALPENHPERATHLNNLANLYESQGKYEAAEQLYLQALEIRKIALPENNPDTAMTLWHLAVHYNNQRIFTSAESFYLKALKIYIAVEAKIRT